MPTFDITLFVNRALDAERTTPDLSENEFIQFIEDRTVQLIKEQQQALNTDLSKLLEDRLQLENKLTEVKPRYERVNEVVLAYREKCLTFYSQVWKPVEKQHNSDEILYREVMMALEAFEESESRGALEALEKREFRVALKAFEKEVPPSGSNIRIKQPPRMLSIRLRDEYQQLADKYAQRLKEEKFLQDEKIRIKVKSAQGQDLQALINDNKKKRRDLATEMREIDLALEELAEKMLATSAGLLPTWTRKKNDFVSRHKQLFFRRGVSTSYKKTLDGMQVEFESMKEIWRPMKQQCDALELEQRSLRVAIEKLQQIKTELETCMETLPEYVKGEAFLKQVNHVYALTKGKVSTLCMFESAGFLGETRRELEASL